MTAPATLVWDFRVLSAASMGLLWGGPAVGFGLLDVRASRPMGGGGHDRRASRARLLTP
ncbi:hypothetical protein [Streptomyces vastus]|uniref:EamA family transporter n=1 Tax=Streptomyces vastus TaxID=285451 RepID=A0ABN3R1Y9_9ACTN